jgi:hypothetical protein
MNDLGMNRQQQRPAHEGAGLHRIGECSAPPLWGAPASEQRPAHEGTGLLKAREIAP